MFWRRCEAVRRFPMDQSVRLMWYVRQRVDENVRIDGLTSQRPSIRSKSSSRSNAEVVELFCFRRLMITALLSPAKAGCQFGDASFPRLKAEAQSRGLRTLRQLRWQRRSPPR